MLASTLGATDISDLSASLQIEDTDEHMATNSQVCRISAQVKSRFAHLFRRKKEVMKVTFLQFLDFKTILKLSRSCKIFKQIIDPVACAGHDEDSEVFERSRTSHHLKLVAAQ